MMHHAVGTTGSGFDGMFTTCLVSSLFSSSSSDEHDSTALLSTAATKKNKYYFMFQLFFALFSCTFLSIERKTAKILHWKVLKKCILSP